MIVYSVYRLEVTGLLTNIKTRVVLTPSLDKSTGYPCYYLNVNGRTKKVYIHRLLAEAYIPNPENKPQVNHINGIKEDYTLTNLEWCTARHNIKESFRLGLSRISELNRSITRERGSKRIFWTHPDYGEFYGSAAELMREFPNQGLGQPGLSNICTGKRKSYKQWYIKEFL